MDVSALLPYGAAVLALAGIMLGLSHVLGERHRAPSTGEPYESGIVSTGRSRVRYSAQFYLVAVFFVIFDLEAVFLFTWAVVAREAGRVALVEAAIFVAVLGVVLAWLWREGSLSWGPRPRVSPGGERTSSR